MRYRSPSPLLLVPMIVVGGSFWFGDVPGDETAAATLVLPAAVHPADLPRWSYRIPPPPPLPRPPALGTERGEATFYSDLLEGRATASGEPLDQTAMVAAHRHHPFGTLVRVTNVANGRSVEVRVIDRGPFAPGVRAPAVIDLSSAAAREIGMFGRGRALVRIEVLAWGDGQD